MTCILAEAYHASIRKKRLTIPFTNQFFHERSLAKKGIQHKFGSYVYSASRLYVSLLSTV